MNWKDLSRKKTTWIVCLLVGAVIIWRLASTGYLQRFSGNSGKNIVPVKGHDSLSSKQEVPSQSPGLQQMQLMVDSAQANLAVLKQKFAEKQASNKQYCVLSNKFDSIESEKKKILAKLSAISCCGYVPQEETAKPSQKRTLQKAKHPCPSKGTKQKSKRKKVPGEFQYG